MDKGIKQMTKIAWHPTVDILKGLTCNNNSSASKENAVLHTQQRKNPDGASCLLEAKCRKVTHSEFCCCISVPKYFGINYA